MQKSWILFTQLKLNFFATIVDMENDILSEVIEVEKEIQKTLEDEKLKAHAWLEQVKKESADELAHEESVIKASMNKAIENAKKDADLKAAEIVRQTKIKADDFAKLTDTTLREAIVKRLTRLLPG